MLQKRFGDATAIITHGKHGPAIDRVRGYMDLTVIIYCIMGIEEQIDHDLLQVLRVQEEVVGPERSS